MPKIDEYLDIINLPHHESRTRKKMSLNDRAAQFAPFAALNGHDDEMKEVARLTEKVANLTNEKIEEINVKLQMIKFNINTIVFRFIYFIKDKKKTGGTYKIVEGKVKDIDDFYKIIVLDDDTIIKIEDIVDIEGDIFNSFYD